MLENTILKKGGLLQLGFAVLARFGNLILKIDKI
jgi:hypothetical protein